MHYVRWIALGAGVGTWMTEAGRENKAKRIGAQRNQFKDFLLLIPDLTLLPAVLA